MHAIVALCKQVCYINLKAANMLSVVLFYLVLDKVN